MAWKQDYVSPANGPRLLNSFYSTGNIPMNNTVVNNPFLANSRYFYAKRPHSSKMSSE